MKITSKDAEIQNETPFSKGWFEKLESKLKRDVEEFDYMSFDEIKSNLKKHDKIFQPDEFAFAVIYVICCSGIKQKTAQSNYVKIKQQLIKNCDKGTLLQILNYPNKINAICYIWKNRNQICFDYYRYNNLCDKLTYIQTLPGIGFITAGHLARNLGEDTAKYDIWIQRLGCAYCDIQENVRKLTPKIHRACVDMFNHLVKETGFQRGYIDVVLFKACKTGLIEIPKKNGNKKV